MNRCRDKPLVQPSLRISFDWPLDRRCEHLHFRSARRRSSSTNFVHRVHSTTLRSPHQLDLESSGRHFSVSLKKKKKSIHSGRERSEKTYILPSFPKWGNWVPLEFPLRRVLDLERMSLDERLNPRENRR